MTVCMAKHLTGLCLRRPALCGPDQHSACSLYAANYPLNGVRF